MPEAEGMTAWYHYNPVRIFSGPGVLSRLPEVVPHNGPVLLVTTPGSTARGLTAQVQSLLGTSRVIVHDRITPNPELDDLDAAVRCLRGHNIQTIVAIGGGSALDAGKTLSVTLACDIPSPLDHVLRKGNKHIWRSSLPLVAIPTTAGTGAEVTPFATVWDLSAAKKHSVTGEPVFPAYALLDPELTLTVPYQETLYTGLDAISHALESLWNRNRTSATEALAMKALNLANKFLEAVIWKPRNLKYRTLIQQASLLAGIAISQTKTAIAHSISYPLTIHYGVPHGLACSFTLVAIINVAMARCNMPNYLNDCFEETLGSLKKLELKREMKKFVNAEEIHVHLSEMYFPERAENTIFHVEPSMIMDILDSSA